ncbi:ABC transporter ATP-binding protein, partial [bacterium]|nr:ABC transporter ATP-binding protein [bacterium]
GKTTAMRSIFGLIQLDDGAVTWDDGPVDRLDRQRFGYMPEERGLYPRMTALAQVSYFARHHGLAKSDAETAARDLLEELGLSARMESRVQDLSHGNQQRVQFAVALVHSPDLMVLDEPFSGLDPLAAHTMAELLRARADAGAAVVFSSHQLDVVEDLCEDVAIINEGDVVLSGKVDQLRAASEHRVVEAAVSGAGSTWAESIPGAEIVSRNGDKVRMVVDRSAEPAAIAAAAAAAGTLLQFSFAPPSLSEVFREAVAP